MSTLLEKAFSEAAKLSLEEQEALANWILAEIASNRRWSEQFANSQNALERLANEALEDYKAGRTQELDPDKL